jgi:hypothetical protein
MDQVEAQLRNAISLIALFVALGGTGYAAIALPDDSVQAQHIERDAVRTSEIRRSAIFGGEIRRDAVSRSDIRAGAVGSDEVADGTLTAVDFEPAPVANLDADLLDGQHAAAFLLKTEKAADADKLDGLQPGEIGRELFARVDTNGAAAPTLAATNRATEAERTNAGNYRVDFGDRDLSQCSYGVSSGEFNSNETAQVELDATDPTRLAVSVHDADAGTNVDGDFNVAVYC